MPFGSDPADFAPHIFIPRLIYEIPSSFVSFGAGDEEPPLFAAAALETPALAR